MKPLWLAGLWDLEFLRGKSLGVGATKQRRSEALRPRTII